jgi:hypothetical protein
MRRDGVSQSDLAARFEVTPARISKVVADNLATERWSRHLAKTYGINPAIASLPDDTPIGVLALCDVEFHGWARRIEQLKPRLRTLGDLRRTPDATLLREPHIGAGFLACLRAVCPHTPPA